MIIIGLVVLLVCFAGVLLVGAPYLPTLSPQVRAAMELANLQPGQHLIELGCGDGRLLIAAAKRGALVTGYELNPILAFVCWLRTLRYRKQVRIICADFWRAEWPQADVIFTFLLPKYMKKLDKKIIQYQTNNVKSDGRLPTVRLVSFAFAVPKKPIESKRDGVFSYIYR